MFHGNVKNDQRVTSKNGGKLWSKLYFLKKYHGKSKNYHPKNSGLNSKIDCPPPFISQKSF
jgi:hypothetical protein